jgi:hypothetical protein
LKQLLPNIKEGWISSIGERQGTADRFFLLQVNPGFANGQAGLAGKKSRIVDWALSRAIVRGTGIFLVFEKCVDGFWGRNNPPAGC